jgi:hypothetical protein
MDLWLVICIREHRCDHATCRHVDGGSEISDRIIKTKPCCFLKAFGSIQGLRVASKAPKSKIGNPGRASKCFVLWRFTASKDSGWWKTTIKKSRASLCFCGKREEHLEERIVVLLLLKQPLNLHARRRPIQSDPDAEIIDKLTSSSSSSSRTFKYIFRAEPW